MFFFNAKKSYAPFIEIFFHHETFLHGNFPKHKTIPPNQKLSPEIACTLLNNYYNM